MIRRLHATTRGYVALIAAIVSVAGTPAVVHGQSPADIRVGYTPLTLVAESSRTDELGGTPSTQSRYTPRRGHSTSHNSRKQTLRRRGG